MRNIDNDNSNTAGTALTPFFDRATHRYCLMALMNTFSVQKVGLEFCNIINNNSNESIFERSSCDLDNKVLRILVIIYLKVIKRPFLVRVLKVTFKPIFSINAHLGSVSLLIFFMDSLHSDLNTKNASFCSISENWRLPTPDTPAMVPPTTDKLPAISLFSVETDDSKSSPSPA